MLEYGYLCEFQNICSTAIIYRFFVHCSILAEKRIENKKMQKKTSKYL